MARRPGEAPEFRPSVAGADLSQVVARAEKRLAEACVDAPRLSAELLAAKAFGLTRLGLIMHAKDQPDAAHLRTFHSLIDRRAAGEPAAYILGEREFYGLPFAVGPDVLVPRPETELIVEEAVKRFGADEPLRFADLGTGSGALAVALAHEFAAARGIAVDVSAPALTMARRNAELNGVAERLEFLLADFTTLDLPSATLDLVVTNPPYVTQDEYAAISVEVREHEPRQALVSPGDGLWHLRGLLPLAWHALKPGGLFFCEIGCGQGRGALLALELGGFAHCGAAILKDYAGLDRILSAIRA